MVWISYWKANSSSATQEIPNLMELKVPLPHSELSTMHTITWYFFKIFLILFTLKLCLPGGLFPLGFQIKILCAFLISPIGGTCLAQPMLIGFYRPKNTDEYRIIIQINKS
jgi:hypothetical protein